ncbi:UDP-N-acetylmuramoyl-tripeptide--D-alanyl-D-alanine ligase [Polaribacter haliotis]|uniref:UDP-N-acetylmuramoyl-tripeptide--D-alanyl-D-alanine ligase n=1 Tax=Polaribacter haliotis TaxID=1888915 RepID=A0A7L8AJT6_9FLAO|nr:UDP-N-acetylmuramoyl-tripeptide--D-alanyl-D-alanine ligase [Polaribacter haliotis]QOD62059.1 UDP-N-acetylmuramoyl-tripeptide--D-alanyl-D-alanine ligase [Polaribacter haliotis]
MNIEDIYKRYTEHYLVDTDTRKIRSNTLFFALKGENFNGNEFAEKALELGAKYAIIDEADFEIEGKTILVDNVLETLQNLAKHHRNQLNIPIIGLTGSNGKTTTKELINCVLSEKYKTTATVGNLNNHIGVPLTLLSITTSTEIGIVEMGANHQKEIAFLCSIAQPDFGYITNFGKAHLEGFEGIEGVIKGKSELYKYLIKNNKTAFVNPKDTIQVEKTENCKSVLFSDKIKFLEANPFVKLTYNSNIISSNLIGKYNYTNIVAAITFGNYFNVPDEKITKAIENYSPTNNRSQIIKTNNNKIILDAYNANPSSMKAALDNFSVLKDTRKTVILGDMFELGEDSSKEHQIIVDLCDSYSFKNTFYVGELFYKTKTKNKTFKTFEDLKQHVIKKPLEDQSILIKGSRGMQLERVLDFIN